MIAIDKALLDRTVTLDKRFQSAIVRLASAPELDLRIFFTMAHGYITSKIAMHAQLLKNPNSLMRLNESFATTYLKAINGAPHADWQKAFQLCKAESSMVQSSIVGLIFEGFIAAEKCGACMAAVHIKRDLLYALNLVKDVDAQDYGNILVFVQEGNIYAETQLRGRAMGSAIVMMGALFVKRLNLDVRQMRNEVFTKAYGIDVPVPSQAFIKEYHRREKRN